MDIRLLSSIQRAFPQQCPKSTLQQLSGMKNEAVSFQVAFRGEPGEAGTCFVSVESELPVSCYRIQNVPVHHIIPEYCDERKEPGLFPDLLIPYDVQAPLQRYRMAYSEDHYRGDAHQVYVSSDCFQALWFTLNEKEQMLSPGTYSIMVRFFTTSEKKLFGETVLSVEILDAVLPPQKTIYTNWFHYDALADYYRVPMFSKRYFALLESYVKAAASHGQNMILLPAFTPALDTPIGGKRPKAQLVSIEKNGNTYAFDFSRMKTFTDLCRKAGIRYFEHTHLFTQWGAKAAPAIYGKVNGRQKQLFGWNTPSDSAEYADFLHAYLAAFRAFMEREDLEVYFHISDEPTHSMMEQYSAAADLVRREIGSGQIMEALSEREFYDQKLVDIPIVVTTAADRFKDCEDLWLYYTGGQSQAGRTTRILYAAPARNRAVGYQLYAHKAKGFLHWGYNFWYDRPSRGLFDPKTDACGYNGSAGTSYIVYPGPQGPILSMRMKVFYEGLCDQRALELAEEKLGRKACMALLERYFGENCSAKSDDSVFCFRQELNRCIMEAKEKRPED